VVSLPRALLSVPRPGAVLLPSRFPVLRARDFRQFWYSTLANNVAGWLLFAAQGWLLLGLTDQPRVVALFLALRLLPKVLLGLPAGALCDRSGALPVLRAARFADMLPALLVSGAALTGQINVAVVLASAALAAAIQAFDQPAHRSLVHRYAPGDLLVGGVALSAIAGTLATLLGPLVLVLVGATVGVAWAFPAQVVLAALSGVLLLGNRAGDRPVRQTQASGTAWWVALRCLTATPMLLALILLAGAPGLLDRLLTLVTPSYADHSGGGAVGATLLFLAPATGALLGGSLLAALDGTARRLVPMALGSSSVAAVSVGLLATTRLFVLAVLLCLLLGVAKTVFSITVMTALQRHIPDHARGRLLAL
jgi:hypothetical protein